MCLWVKVCLWGLLLASVSLRWDYPQKRFAPGSFSKTSPFQHCGRGKSTLDVLYFPPCGRISVGTYEGHTLTTKGARLRPWGLFKLEASHKTQLCPTLPYPTLLYSTLPYSTLPYPTLPCPTPPYPTLPDPTGVLFSQACYAVKVTFGGVEGLALSRSNWTH